MSLDKRSIDGYQENGLLGDILGGRNLEGFIYTLEQLTFFVSDTVREHLRQRKRSTQFEQQVLGWFLSLSDIDFEIISSQNVSDGRVLGVYKAILQDLRNSHISVSNSWRLGGCDVIAIGDSPLISGMSLKFQNEKIVHITPEQFQLFAQLWKNNSD